MPEVMPVSRKVLEGKVLACIGEGDTVGILATREDLSVIIQALRSSPSVAPPGRLLDLVKGLETLQREAFGGT